MRSVAVPVLLGLVGLLGAGCTGTGSSTASSRGSSTGAGTTPQAGCGLVPESGVVGLLGHRVTTRTQGTLEGLRKSHSDLTCRNGVPGHPERYVTIRAQYHPKPLELPSRSCSAGWVYAGTPQKFTPACQESLSGHGRTQLFVRWQPYVMHVTIGRQDRSWGGDPEAALAMSRSLAQHLGVEEARGDG